jgi:hypothetical protein
LEDEEVVFLKSWFEYLDGVKEQAEEQHEQANKKAAGKEEEEDEKVEMVDFDDGGGAFTKVNRKRARPKKKTVWEGTL